MNDIREDQDKERYVCDKDNHFWIYSHDSNSIPTDYRYCQQCDVIDCSEAIERREKKLTLQLKAAELRATEAEAGLHAFSKAADIITEQLEKY